MNNTLQNINIKITTNTICDNSINEQIINYSYYATIMNKEYLEQIQKINTDKHNMHGIYFYKCTE